MSSIPDTALSRPVPKETDGRLEYYERAAKESLSPLWRVMHSLVPASPRANQAVPAFWSYATVRPYLMEACEVISTQEAQRRVLILENPGLFGQHRATPSLFAGLQVIRPREVAPAHRHVASALRFIVEGKDAYTAVAGERTMMEEGDFVTTPSWTWHDHGNEGDAPMVWMDGLDMHIVNMFSASFREDYPGDRHPLTRPEGSAWAEAGANLRPVGFQPASQSSPIFNYPYRVTREALHGLARLRDPDPCHGHKMVYVNPMNGGAAMPTMTTAMRLLPKGFKSEPYRCTAGEVFSVVEGTGVVRIEDQSFAFGPRDSFVVPSWFAASFEAASDAVMFSFSDQVAQEKLDLFREARGSNAVA